MGLIGTQTSGERTPIPAPPAIAPATSLEIQEFVVWDLELEGGGSLPQARLGCCIIALDPHNPWIILHPALTGSPRVVVDGNPSQGDGWWKKRVGPGNFIDTNCFNVLCVDHLGGNGHSPYGHSSGHGSTSAKELLEFRPSLRESLRLQDTINLVARVLEERLEVSSVHAVVGGSIGAGQALGWLFQDRIKVDRILDISGKSGSHPVADEFFQIQSDLIWSSGRGLADLEHTSMFE